MTDKKYCNVILSERLAEIHENIKKLTGQSISQQLLQADMWYLLSRGILDINEIKGSENEKDDI